MAEIAANGFFIAGDGLDIDQGPRQFEDVHK
jgi:hypothetical protein